jgi:hypothetical protein
MMAGFFVAHEEAEIQLSNLRLAGAGLYGEVGLSSEAGGVTRGSGLAPALEGVRCQGGPFDGFWPVPAYTSSGLPFLRFGRRIMRNVRCLVVFLLCLTGSMHLVRLGMEEAPAGIVVFFGLAYLLIAGLFYRHHRAAAYLGGIVPAIGLCTGPWILAKPPAVWAIFLGVVEVVIVVSCWWLIYRARRASDEDDFR